VTPGRLRCDSPVCALAALVRRVRHSSLPRYRPSSRSAARNFSLTRATSRRISIPEFNALSYIPESAWNETLGDIDAGYGGLGASGGGASGLFAKPYWQGPYTPNDGHRDVPDVALSASSDILPYAVSTSWTSADGDAEAPTGAGSDGVWRDVGRDSCFCGDPCAGQPGRRRGEPQRPGWARQREPDAVRPGEQHHLSKNAFHDIVTGDNIVPCQPGSPDCPSSPPYQFGYKAGPGYDQVTGLGSIDAANLVAAWKALAPTSTTLHVTAAGATVGAPIQLTATVVSRATANAMTGSVTFYFVSPGDGGVGISGTLGSLSSRRFRYRRAWS
jgi:hypothetical protein